MKQKIGEIAHWVVYWCLALVVIAALMATTLKCASTTPVAMYAAQALEGHSKPGPQGDPIYFLTYRYVDGENVTTTVHDQVVDQREYIRYWKALVPFCVQPNSLSVLRLVPCNLTVPYPG